MAKPKTVNGYIGAIESEHQEGILDYIRELILSLDERIIEGVKYGVPFYWMNKNLLYLSPKAEGVNLGFVYGHLLPDDFNILTGDGKQVRHIYLEDIDFIKKHDDAIRATIYQAIDLELSRT